MPELNTLLPQAYGGFLTPGSSVKGSISSLGEYDTYTQTYIAGLTYSVKVSGAYSGGGTLADPNLALYDPSGTRIMFNDDIVAGVNRDAQLTFKVNTTGNFTLMVGEQGNNATGSYTVLSSVGYATNNAETVNGTNYADGINGMGGNDAIRGFGGNDVLLGGDGADAISGGTGNDGVYGDSGNDVLYGGDGNDYIVGGAGADRMTGGLGADRFVFRSAAESSGAAPDRILAGEGATAMQGVGVAGGDLIDLSQIDANAYLSGNQAFTWSSARTAGTLYLSESNGNTVVYGHTNNDGVADFSLVIADGTGITASSYIGSDFVL